METIDAWIGMGMGVHHEWINVHATLGRGANSAASIHAGMKGVTSGLPLPKRALRPQVVAVAFGAAVQPVIVCHLISSYLHRSTRLRNMHDPLQVQDHFSCAIALQVQLARSSRQALLRPRRAVLLPRSSQLPSPLLPRSGAVRQLRRRRWRLICLTMGRRR